MLACAWGAHMGTPIIYTNKNGLPSKTIDLIKQNNITSIYVLGSDNSIAFDILKEIKGIKNTINVQRIQGNSIYETSVNFMKFYDAATMFGWGSYQK
jgi:putative cell wall-binding protein